ncbi:hypothetical protein [Duganella sp. LjRoot269]|jgi:hypothetical protein|uniref:hypothetical protein n=1 Tax=Duganella sp. LjRoot269 TaxID=3342305 RepID=UPI003ECFF96D
MLTTMRTLVRFLLWMLIAALPLQAVAAAVMPIAALTMPAPVAAQPAAHAGHCASAEAGKSKASAGEHGKCNHCAGCCAGASAPPGVPAVTLPAVYSGSGISAGEPAMTAYIPATLERPPRLS